MSPRVRLDVSLVERGLAGSRARAQHLVAQGQVTVDGRVVRRVATPVAESQLVEVAAPRQWVGRGAEKLLAALGAFDIVVTGRAALDVGASTGGFTEVLLDHGARSVVALDVGHGQLHSSLRARPEVRVLEGFNVRDLTGQDLPEPVDLVTVDVSFIPLSLVLAPVAATVRPGADLVVLVKPQFEVGQGGLDKHGVVRSVIRRHEAVASVVAAAEALGLGVWGVTRSPLVGAAGNVEYLLWLRAAEQGRMSAPDITTQLRSEEAR